MEQDQLDQETFVCDNCKGQFRAVDGAWPIRAWNGDWIVETTNEHDWPKPKFMCYDCAP